MKKSRLILIGLLSLVLLSCTKESFSLSSYLLYRNIYVSDDGRKEEAVLKLSLSSPSDDESYTFLLVSPDGDLRWDGRLEKNGSYYVSDTLGITDGAAFEEGDYTIYIYSASGSEVDASIPMQKEEGNYTFDNASRKDDADIVYYDREGFTVSEGEEADRAVVKYTDRYSNRITLRAEFNL